MVRGEATCLPGLWRQALERVFSLAYQKLRGTAQQKLPMDMLVLEDEKHHGAPNLALQKVKVSGRRIQGLRSGARPGSRSLAPPSVVLEAAAQDPGGLVAMQQVRQNAHPRPAESESAQVQIPGQAPLRGGPRDRAPCRCWGRLCVPPGEISMLIRENPFPDHCVEGDPTGSMSKRALTEPREKLPVGEKGSLLKTSMLLYCFCF